jgi:hypothetical protein
MAKTLHLFEVTNNGLEGPQSMIELFHDDLCHNFQQCKRITLHILELILFKSIGNRVPNFAL